MGKDVVSLNVSDEVVQPIIMKEIQAAVVRALGDSDRFIEIAVKQALNKKVSSNGSVSSSNYDNKYDYLEIIAGNSIRKAAEEVLREYLDAQKEKLKAAVLKELKSPARQKSLIRAYADALEKSLSCSWRMNCDIKFVTADNS